MPSNHTLNIRKRDPVSDDAEDARSLLDPSNNDNNADVDAEDHVSPRLRPSRRQSPLHSHTPPRTPRTTNRVRFDLAENEHASNHTVEDGSWAQDGDEEERGEDSPPRYHTSPTTSAGQRAPLLTDIEAPSVTVANTSLRLNIEELLEDVNRPKSGMVSAFMNMANSIM